MYIDRVTFTGADDSVNPEELISRIMTLCENSNSFIELAILVGREYEGHLRLPSKQWINKFCDCVTSMTDEKVGPYHGMFISTHLCGDYVKEFLHGKNSIITELPKLWNLTNRVQLNTHGIPHTWNSNLLSSLIIPNTNHISSEYASNKEFIFQMDEVNDRIFKAMVVKDANATEDGEATLVTPLFDMSHGAGIHTKDWPSPCYRSVWHGYAGGIGPDNIFETIEDINKVCGIADSVWIDMETKIRSGENSMFDLGKVTAVVEQLPGYSSHGITSEEVET